MPLKPFLHVSSLRASHASLDETTRAVPEETPIALVYDGATHAVMMATPADLEDFAVGLSLTERIVANASEITATEIVEHDRGVELRMWLEQSAGMAAAQRRRRIVGPTGCGLCGVDSLDAAVPVPPVVDLGPHFSPDDIMAALASLPAAQALNQATRAVHGAAFWTPATGLAAIREDVGRHNALDKLAGAIARTNADAQSGIVLLTSRVSVEMVQKTAAIGAPVIVAISAPTALAIRTADAANITLVAVARSDSFEVFTGAARITPVALQQENPPAHVRAR